MRYPKLLNSCVNKAHMLPDQIFFTVTPKHGIFMAQDQKTVNANICLHI